MATQDVPTRWSIPTSAQVVRDVAANLVLVLLSAVLTVLAFPPFEWWPLAWVALVPLLAALRLTVAIRAAGWLMLLWGVLVAAGTLHWLSTIFHGGAIGIFLVVALPWVLFGLAYRVLAARPVAVLCLTPVLWLAAEWVRCEGWYFQFSWLQLGFTQVAGAFPGYPRFLFPLVGTYGVTALIVLINAALLSLFDAWRARRRADLPAVIAVALLPVLLPVGPLLTATQTTSTEHTVNAIIVQDEDHGIDRLKELSYLHARGDASPTLLVWPEYAVPTYILEGSPQLGEVQAVARDLRAVMVLGTKERAPDTAPVDALRKRGMLLSEGNLFYNTALILGPDGGILGTYHKAHPIQFFADGVPGRAHPAFKTPAGPLGVAICYDCDYAWPLLQAVRNGAELLAVPTMDALAWTPLQHRQHARMAQARAAELGRPMARATTSGVSQLLDAHGNERITIPVGGSSAVAARLQPTRTMTPYASFFFLLPHLCLAASLLWLLWTAIAWLHTRKNSSSPAGDAPAAAN
jgi:apolipoprotein N-acyltransferase